MKRIILSFCFVLVFFNVSFTQAFADKEYYLIDSLRLENLSKADLQLVDSCLKVYYKATDDTSKGFMSIQQPILKTKYQKRKE
jgi:hypothetical protein